MKEFDFNEELDIRLRDCLSDEPAGSHRVNMTALEHVKSKQVLNMKKIGWSGAGITAAVAVIVMLILIPKEYDHVVVPTSTPVITPDATPSITPEAPPIDLADVSFSLAELKDYLVFDQDGLTIPDIRAVFEQDELAYENREPVESAPDFYLDAAEYDLNQDGVNEYIIKRPNPVRMGGMKSDECFIDILYLQDGHLNRMNISNKNFNYELTPIAILNTKHNGFYDFSITNDHSNKYVYAFNGNEYECKALEHDSREWYEGYFTSGDSIKKADDLLSIQYQIKVFGHDYKFFVAGLFISAEEDGFIKQDRLWACDENGNPKLFSVNDATWFDLQFWGDYIGSVDESLENFPGMDEFKIIIYE